jgi:hypothetical protein
MLKPLINKLDEEKAVSYAVKPKPRTAVPSITTQKYAFSDNTWTGKFPEVDAVVQTRSDGIRVVFPVSYNHKFQQITREQANQWIDNVHPRLRAVMDGAAFHDVKPVGRPNVFATAGHPDIDFWANNKSMGNLAWVEGTFSHESAHVFDRVIGGSVIGKPDNLFKDMTDQPFWKDAMTADKKINGEKSPTDYGQKNNAEDFAESVQHFLGPIYDVSHYTDNGFVTINSKEDFIKRFPNRARILERLFYEE